jgi:hypothetical protein
MVVAVVKFMVDAPAFLSGLWNFHFDSFAAVCEGGGVHTIATSPLAGFCSGQFRATVLWVIGVFLRALVFGSFERFRRFTFLRLIEYRFTS